MTDKETSRKINTNEYREANVNDDGAYVEGDYQNSSGGGDNVGGNKTEYHYYGNSNQQETVKREKNQQTLLDWIETEVNSRLNQSLHNRISILLDKEEDPLSVSPFWEMELKVDTRKQEKLPSETTIFSIYNREDIKGRLLILGEPGSGKTTTLLQLAKVLVERAKNDPDQPIPILFNLSAWKEDKQSIHEWIIESLKAPPYGIKREISDQWLQEGIILPLLDGLDELASARQKLCIDKLNEYLGKERAQLPLVICSRVKEFKHNQTALFLNGSIILQALREEQIKDYVERTEGIALWEDIEQDSELLDLCKIPFFLSIIVIAYERISLEKWQTLASVEEKKTYLLERYIQRMFDRSYRDLVTKKEIPKPFYDQKTRHWLIWLAIQITKESETEFFIEHIQPYWLKSKQGKLIYGMISGLIFGLIFALISGMILKLISGLILGFILGLILGLIIGLMIGLDTWLGLELMGKNKGNWTRLMFSKENMFIKPVETIGLSFTKKKKEIIDRLTNLLIAMVMIMIAWWIQSGNMMIALVISLNFMLLGVVFTVLSIGLVGKPIDIKTSPNQGIKESVKNSLKIFAIVLIIILITIIPIIHFFVTPVANSWEFDTLVQDSYFVVIIMMLGSIIGVGKPAIQHFSLRLILTLKNYAPWNYAKFLDYATNRLFLQRVGGGYRFIHRMLQEHFASYHK